MADAKENVIELERKAVDEHTVVSTHQAGYTTIIVKSTFGSHESVSDLLYHTVLKKLQAS